jgi:tetratricopeptide (TPR) repeat protein
MAMVKKLKVATGAIALAAAVVSAYVWGDSSGNKSKSPSLTDLARSGAQFGEDVAAGKFTRLPVITYQTAAKETLFALQVKPALDPVPPRPRDILVLLDTSASAAGAPLALAKRIARELVNDAGPRDRVAIWTVNTPRATRSLTSGFQYREDNRGVEAALAAMDMEYASGAVDLKGAIEKALKDFEGKQSRQQLVVYLGDGESAYEPLAERDRYALAEQMAAANISFFAVPLGLSVHPTNMHALVSGTGGAVVRVEAGEAKDPKLAQTGVVSRLNKAFSVPVLAPTNFQLGPDVAEVYPSKLPPLRADTPTLVVGRFAGAGPQKIAGTIEGKVVGKSATVKVEENVPPPLLDHFFLSQIVGQWRDSSYKEAPALLRADRTLALAYQQARLNLDELINQGQWAIGAGNFDAARELFESAHKVDPNDSEANAGLKVVEKLKKGEMTREQFKALLQPKTGLGFERDPGTGATKVVRVNLEQLAQEPIAPPGAKAPGPPAPGGDEMLRQEQAQRAVLEQQTRRVVEETLQRARRLMRDGDPDSARDIVMQQRDSIRANPDISETLRQRLLAQMELDLRDIGTEGARIKQQLAQEREQIARARERILRGEQEIAAEQRDRERIRALTTLMRQARFEDVYREAQVFQEERLNNGEPLLLEAQAFYRIGQAANNLREMRELVRLREDRFLLAMLQVEKAHVPYPDEPPVHFPPSKVWRDLLELRKKYAASDFEGDLPPRVRKRLGFLKESLNSPLPMDRAIEGVPLKEVIDYLEDVASPLESKNDPSLRVKIIANDAAFKAARGENFRIEDELVRLPRLTGASLSTALRILSAQFGGTYIVRRDYIELTTAEEAIRDKVVRVFPVEDLVVPIPNGVAQQALNQNLSVLGQTFSLGGGNAFGFVGAFGGGQGFLGQFGIGGGGFQQPGGGGAGQQQIGGLFQGQNVNLGAQGGIQGFGGGQLGQFGNLGGQFGFQGGTQDALLIQLIKEVIARGEWTGTASILGGIGVTQQGPNAANDPTLDPSSATLPQDQLNSLGYYPPARALVVRATSRFHKSQSSRLSKPAGGVGAENRFAAGATPDVQEQVGGFLGDLRGKGNAKPVAGNDKAGGQQQVAQAGKPKALSPQEFAAKADPALRRHADKDWDPKKVWDQELAKGGAEPGLVIACVDFLSQAGSFNHAAELLKASLRQGLTPEPWAQEALAIALEGAQGSQEEIERARFSAIDLEPTSAQAYLRASKAAADLGDVDRALRFCRQAARLQPDTPDPYLNAMAYAGQAKQGSADVSVWAADSLLRRDWPLDSADLHAQAKQHLTTLLARLQKENRATEAKKVQQMLEGDRESDLVIQLLWSGPADLDLKVHEAIGTVCSATQKQTTAGGVLQSSDLMQNDLDHRETYTAVQAFDGSYQIAVDRVWGRPLGNKATVKVIRHQGTPQQSVELFTLQIDKDPTLVVKFEGGRRSELATVPPPVVATNSAAKPERKDQVMSKLKAITDPAYSGLSGGFGVAADNATAGAFVPNAAPPAVDVAYQTRVREALPGGAEMQVSAVISSDINKSQLRLKPVFQTAHAQATARLSLVPGGGD